MKCDYFDFCSFLAYHNFHINRMDYGESNLLLYYYTKLHIIPK